MITFLKETNTFFLENERVTYAFGIRNGELEHLWFGAKIGHDDLTYLRTGIGSGCDAGLPGRYSPNHHSQELPVYGQGDFREPMLTWRGENGDLCAELRYVSHRIVPQQKTPGMPSTFGGETLEVVMLDAIQGIEVTLLYTLFDDVDAITRSCRIRNVGEQTVRLTRAYSFALDLTVAAPEAISLQGAWARERTPERVPLHHGVWSIDSKRVTSSSQLNPFVALVEKDTTENAGSAWGVSLVYSSSYRLFAEVGPNGRTRIGGGINDFAFDWTLCPEETLATPEVILAYSAEGLGGMSRILHDTLRRHLINPRYVGASRPVVINNWEATYFNFDKEKLFAIIDASAGTGIDTFVLDDGWFGKRDNDHSGLGDWFVNTEKLEGGLNPIIDRCHERGLKFGLWFEPEMVNPDSDLYRAHPDWAIHAPGHALCEGRNQCVLDLTRPEVRDYIVGAVSDILSNHEIDYVKWDYNRNITEVYSEGLPADRQGEFAHRYALGLYDICERLVFGFPNVFFEGCASGGARFDPAILYYFPQIWTSDNSDAYARTQIQWGTSLCYPLSAMSCHVSVCPNHQTRRVTPLKTRADIAHLGATGYELNVSHMKPEELEQIPAQIADYRAMEQLVMEGDLWRLASPFDSNLFAFELVSKDKSEAHVTLMHVLRTSNNAVEMLRLGGLEPDAVYECVGDGARYHGSTLMNVGLLVPTNRLVDFETLVWHFKKI